MAVTVIWLAIGYTIGAYLSGSICSAVLISRAFSLPDPRREGSRNPGATNVLRLAGKKYALLVLCVDMLKGLIPVSGAHVMHMPTWLVSVCALAAVLGHMYPIFFKFQGGKGVATTLGALLGLNPILGGLLLLTWLLIATISRFSSLASILCISIAPVYWVCLTQDSLAMRPLLVITALVLYQHSSNIIRLYNHTEPKIKLGTSKHAS